MAIRDIFTVRRRTFINPGAWFNYDGLKTSNQVLWTSFREALFPTRSDVVETFAESVKRLGLTPNQVETIAKNYRFYAYGFLSLGIITLLFAFYLVFFYQAFLAFILAIMAGGLFGIQAFKYHFWYFQMKHRQLGCTFKEWWQGKPNREVKSHD